jgi:putative transposase
LDSGLPGENRKRWEVHYDPYDITVVWLRDHRSSEWVTVPWVYRFLAGQPFGLALWEHARRMTMDRSGPRPAEADIARNVADLLNRAHGTGLSPGEAHPEPEPEDPAAAAEDGSETEQSEPDSTAGPDAYEVFDPGGVPWRL